MELLWMGALLIVLGLVAFALRLENGRLEQENRRLARQTLWVDTETGKLRMRNAADDGWVDLMPGFELIEAASRVAKAWSPEGHPLVTDTDWTMRLGALRGALAVSERLKLQRADDRRGPL